MRHLFCAFSKSFSLLLAFLLVIFSFFQLFSQKAYDPNLNHSLSFSNSIQAADNHADNLSASALTTDAELKNIYADIILPNGYVNISNITDFAVDSGRGFFGVLNEGIVCIDMERVMQIAVIPYTFGAITSISIHDSILYALDTTNNILLIFDISKTVNNTFELLHKTSSTPQGDDYLGVRLRSVDVCFSLDGSHTMIFVLSDGMVQCLEATVQRITISQITTTKITLGLPKLIRAHNYSNAGSLNASLFGDSTITYRLSFVADSTYSADKQTIYLYDFDVDVLNNIEAEPTVLDVMKENSERIDAVSTNDGTSFVCVFASELAVIDDKNMLLFSFPFNDNAISKGRLSSPSSVAMDENTVFVLDSLYSKFFLQAFSLSTSLAFQKNIFCSADKSNDRLYSPRSAVAGTDRVYVADYNLGRVSVRNTLTNMTSIIDGFTRPTKLELTGDGNLYVVDNTSRLSLYSRSLEKLSEYTDFSIIGDIALTSDDTLYVTDTVEKKVFCSTDGVAFFEVVSNITVQRLSANSHTNAVFGLDDSNRIVRIEQGKEVQYLPFDSSVSDSIIQNNAFIDDVRDIAVDNDKNLYALVSNEIIRFEYDSTSDGYKNAVVYNILTRPLEGYDYFVSFSISRAASKLAYYGDVLLCDRDGGSVRKITADVLDVAVVDYLVIEAPVNWEQTSPIGNSINFQVRVTLNDTSLFSAPNTRYVLTGIQKNHKAIVLKYDIDYNEFFCFAVLEAEHEGEVKFLSGYLLKSALSNALPFTSYSFRDAVVLNSNTAVYRYPSMLAPKILNGGIEMRLNKNLATKVLNFAYIYTDINFYEWLAIDVEGQVMFVLASNIIGKHYISNDSNLRTNARLVSNNVDYIPIYVLENDEYVLIEDMHIPKNSRVALFSRFNKYAEFTRVLYTDAYGSVDCFVETKYVAPDELSNTQIVAIIIFCFILILAGIFLSYTLRTKLKARPTE